MAIKGEIGMFFNDPMKVPDSKVYSNLYLLRRDAIQCLGKDPSTGLKNGCECLFPAAMVVLAGIDLIAKFKYGDNPKEVGKRFKCFTFSYISQEFSEEIYQLRNSLLHSFGLYSEAYNGKIYKFILVRGRKSIIDEYKDTFEVDIDILHKRFEKAIEKFHNEILKRSTKKDQDRFKSMFAKYGSTWIDI